MKHSFVHLTIRKIIYTSIMDPSTSTSNTSVPIPTSSSDHTTLEALLGTSLRLLLRDHRTIQGTLQLLDRSSLLLSNTLETKPPPTTEAEWEVFENRDRYYPRSNDAQLQEIKGLGIAREIGAVLVGFADVLKIEVEKGDWENLTRGRHSVGKEEVEGSFQDRVI